jgi:hypothetical protein
MIDRHHPDPADRAALTDQDLAIATLVGRYIERRETRQPPRTHDLFAVAAVRRHRRRRAPDRARLYEAMRASEDHAP